ncbi:unnamed protein product [Porites evermanni]|uniref:Uncharacterized protein n=1 Tax=Porites evermanni TaxID=104178 RepID=A0ABN8RN66_9CNID|nr:unnamed protein product [Porites evermanni]
MEVRGVVGCFLFYLLISSKYSTDNASSIAKNSRTCLQGPPGLPGRNGVNGHNGLPGRDRRDGAKGERGVAGPPGSQLTQPRKWLIRWAPHYFNQLSSQCRWKPETQTRAFKDRLASLDVTESMDITGYQAATGEMVLKVKTAW